jgi:hypothetical protein
MNLRPQRIALDVLPLSLMQLNNQRRLVKSRPQAVDRV